MDGNQVNIEPDDIVTSNGIRFPLDVDFITARNRRALRRNLYEAKETHAALKTVRDGDTVIELGAGIGYMSTLVATRRELASVHAFEANPTLVPYIERVHALNGVTNGHVHNAILGKKAGKATFYVRRNIVTSSLDRLDGGGIVAEEEVEMRAAGKVFKEIRPTVLIADIEGAEADLIPLLDLSTIRAAIIELHPQWIGPQGTNAVFQAFLGAGLAYYARASEGKVVAFRRNW